MFCACPAMRICDKSILPAGDKPVYSSYDIQAACAWGEAVFDLSSKRGCWLAVKMPARHSAAHGRSVSHRDMASMLALPSSFALLSTRLPFSTSCPPASWIRCRSAFMYGLWSSVRRYAVPLLSMIAPLSPTCAVYSTCKASPPCQ